MRAADRHGWPALDDGVAVELRLIEQDRSGAAERVALVATDATGACVGRATSQRVYGPRAAVTLWIAGTTWLPGLTEALLAGLQQHAADTAISTLLLRVPAGDTRLRRLLGERFGAREVGADGAYVDVELRCDRAAAGDAAP